MLIGVLTLGVQGAQAVLTGLTGPETSSTAQPPPALAAAATPVEITISTADISVPIDGRGLDAEGEIDPPQDEVMWYTGHDRVTPGQLGTAVVAGHVSYYGEPDVFADLASVQEGDRVTITYADGSTDDFAIVSTHRVDKEELRQSDLVWGDQTSSRRLAIVTCDEALGFGDDGHRRANFVAIAEPA